MGLLIEIEGYDRVGKDRQNKRLANILERKGYEVELFTFPTYKESSNGVLTHLNGGFKTLPNSAVAYLYAYDRLMCFVENKVQSFLSKPNSIVICERYVMSSMLYLMSTSANHYDKFSQMQAIYANEFIQNKLPRPDIIFFLDIKKGLSVPNIDSGDPMDKAEKSASILYDKIQKNMQFLKNEYPDKDRIVTITCDETLYSVGESGLKCESGPRQGKLNITGKMMRRLKPLLDKM